MACSASVRYVECMGSKPTRRLVISMVLLAVMIVMTIRSIWYTDTLCWRTMDGERNTVTLASYGLETGQLGLRIYAYQQVIETLTIQKMNDVLNKAPSVGLALTSAPLTPKPGFWRRMGIGLDRGLDEKTYSLSTESGIILPLWLMAVLLAVRPARYFHERLQACAAASGDRAGQRDRGPLMRYVIAMIAGLMVGMAVMFFAMRHPNSAAQSGATNVIAPPPPIHPIVGMWRIHYDPIVATYTFGDDGKFILIFRGVPRRNVRLPRLKRIRKGYGKSKETC